MKAFCVGILLLSGAALAAEGTDPAPAEAPTAKAAPAKKHKAPLKLGLVPRKQRTSYQQNGGGGARDLLGNTKPINHGPSDATREGMLRQQAEEQRLQGTLPNPYYGNSKEPPQVAPNH
jgi:hypothetical protein